MKSCEEPLTAGKASLGGVSGGSRSATVTGLQRLLDRRPGVCWELESRAAGGGGRARWETSR